MKPFFNLISFAVIISAFTTGCSLHHVEEPDPGPLPETFTGQTASIDEPALPGRWWDHFRDSGLNDIIENALANNLDIIQAIARLEQTEAITQVANSVRSPFLTFESQISRDSQPSFASTTTSNNYRLSLSTGFEVDLWHKLKSQTNAAHAEELASREAVRSIFLTVSARAADLYYLAAGLRSQLKLEARLIDSHKMTLSMVDERYQAGLAKAQDLYKNRQNHVTSQIERTELQAKLSAAEHGLAVLMGKIPGKAVSGGLRSLPDIPSAFPTGLPTTLLKNRPDVRAAELRVLAQDERVGAAIAARFPSINLLANYGRIRVNYGTPITDTFWNLFAGLTQPLVDGGRLKAEANRSKAALKEELAHYRQTVLQALQDVENILDENFKTAELLRLVKEQATIATASLRLAEDGFQKGLTDYLAVLTAQRKILSIEKQITKIHRQLLADRISLARAIGGSWTENVLQKRLGREK